MENVSPIQKGRSKEEKEKTKIKEVTERELRVQGDRQSEKELENILGQLMEKRQKRQIESTHLMAELKAMHQTSPRFPPLHATVKAFTLSTYLISLSAGFTPEAGNELVSSAPSLGSTHRAPPVRIDTAGEQALSLIESKLWKHSLSLLDNLLTCGHTQPENHCCRPPVCGAAPRDHRNKGDIGPGQSR